MNSDFLFRNYAKSESELIFKEYFGRLSYFAFQFVNDQQIAEDLVQDAFVAFWAKKQEISEHPIAIKNFLYTSVRFAALNHIKRQKVHARYFLLTNKDYYSSAKILENIIEAEVSAKLHYVISNLPKRCRDVFRLAYFEELTNSKIAEKLGISINTVRNHKQNGLKILRSQLDIESFMVILILIQGN